MSLRDSMYHASAAVIITRAAASHISAVGVAALGGANLGG